MATDSVDQQHGTNAVSTEFSRYDQVDKPTYHLAEAADGADAFDDDFEFTTCDLGRYLHGNDADKAVFATELGEAMRDIGFVILEGHGVDQALIEEAEAAIPTVFTKSSLDDKMRYRAERHGAVSEGYFPIKETSDIHPDLVEGWVFGRRAFDLDDSTEGDEAFNPAAFWAQPELEPLFRRLVQAELPLFQPIMAAILQALDCDPTLFDEKLTAPNLGLRLNYYPPLDATDQASGAGRLLGHEDIDLFTLLPAPAVEGLQVLRRSESGTAGSGTPGSGTAGSGTAGSGTAGKWVRMKAPRGSIIMNTGDYLQRITNDIMPSTTHRVSPPQDQANVGKARVSLPLAAYLRPHEILEVLPGIANPKYDPIEVITFHTRTTAKFYGDDYAVE